MYGNKKSDNPYPYSSTTFAKTLHLCLWITITIKNKTSTSEIISHDYLERNSVITENILRETIHSEGNALSERLLMEYEIMGLALARDCRCFAKLKTIRVLTGSLI